MKNPKEIEVIRNGSTYSIPMYFVDNDGLKDAPEEDIFVIPFCKGNKEDELAFRQTGVFTESLLQVALEYLKANNVGEVASRETSIAITKIEEALLWLGKRAEDRKMRGVQGTYKQ